MFKEQTNKNSQEPAAAAPDVVRLPLLTLKLFDADSTIELRQKALWFSQSFFSSLARRYLSSLKVAIPLFICIAISTLSHITTDGIYYFQHFPFLLDLATINFFMLLGLAVIALPAALASSSATSWQYPQAIFLSSAGLSIGSANKCIPWKDILAVQTKELIFRGTRRSSVLEFYIDNATYKNVASATLTKDNNFHFLDCETNKLVKNDYDVPCLRLPMALFGFDTDIQKLVKSLTEHLGPATLISMPAVTTTQSRVSAFESYTALWLQELSAPGAPSADRVLSAGHSLQGGRYIISDVLGYGGFSVVYAIADQPLAIKEVMIHSGGTRASKDKMLQSIVQEIDLLRTLDHPKIVKCLDFFIEAGRFYIVMQAVPGDNLRDFVRKNIGTQPLSENELIEVARQCCEILEYLHARSKPLIHRDFTPDNLIWNGQTVKLIDFNVAEEVNTSASRTVVGKHSYLAPEQWCGTFTIAGDLYQLGCSLYFLATGVDPEPLAQSNLRGVRPDLSTEFCDIVSKLTERELENRYATAADTANALNSIVHAEPIRAQEL
jgi:serine/threonine protein kinase